MFQKQIKIQLEEELRKDIWDSLEGNIVSTLIKDGKPEKSGNYYKHILEGHSFKASFALLPRIHKIFSDTLRELNFEEPVELYITNSPTINASATTALETGEPHIINVSSSLIEKYDEMELKFIIGHELGHILAMDSELNQIIEFVFPDETKIPLLLSNKISLWERLSELNADRVGLLACKSLEKCISSFFKLSSGLNIEKTNFDFQTFLDENEKRIEYLKNEKAINAGTHPVNPVRIKAIKRFFDSDLYTQIINRKKITADIALNTDIDEIINLLLTLRSSELDRHRSIFIASAGIVMAEIDNKLNEDEFEHILSVLSNYLVFPSDFLRNIIQKGIQYDLFIESTQHILKVNPAESDSMFEYLIQIAISDNELFKKELEFLYDIGIKIFGYSKKEMAQRIGYIIQKNFVPKLY